MTNLTSSIIGTVVIAAGALVVHAQDGGRGATQGRGGAAGRGAEARPAVKPHKVDLENMYVHYPLAPEDAAYTRMSGDHVKQYVNEIAAISRKDRDGGNRF